MRTAEFVSPGHPDKICDQISDAILDECMRQDPQSRVAVETMAGHGIITITGEITTKAYVDVKNCVYSVIGSKYGVQVNLAHQSPNIATGVDSGGAGDQGIMVGYACNETDSLMPLEYELARSLCRHLYSIHPRDGKTQITINDKMEIVAVVASWHGVETEELTGLIDGWLMNQKTSEKFYRYANPAGYWSVGGLDADTGLTGRKIVIDSYGPRVPVGGGAFSGKDPSKVDRSGAYMARRIAVDFLKKYGEKECRVELAYAIGKKEPIQAIAWVDGNPITITGYDLTPIGIIGFLNLKCGRPFYQNTAEWGHFGNNFPWEI